MVTNTARAFKTLQDVIVNMIQQHISIYTNPEMGHYIKGFEQCVFTRLNFSMEEDHKYDKRVFRVSFRTWDETVAFEEFDMTHVTTSMITSRTSKELVDELKEEVLRLIAWIVMLTKITLEQNAKADGNV